MRYDKPKVEIIEDSSVESSITNIDNLTHQQRLKLFNSPEHNPNNNLTFEEMVKQMEEEEFRKREYEKAIIKNKSQNGLNRIDKYDEVDGFGFNITIESDMDL